MALESYGVGATFLFKVFSQNFYGLGADLKLQLIFYSDWLRTISTGIIKWFMQMIQVIHCSNLSTRSNFFVKIIFLNFLRFENNL
jgi:hypothetical protein